MTDPALTLPERLLANEMANYLAQILEQTLEIEDGEIYNEGQFNFEAACETLDLLGIYEHVKDFTRYKVLVSAEKIPAFMIGLKTLTRQAFEKLLSVFIEQAISYSADLKGIRTNFTVPPHMETSAELLTRCGYLEAQGNSYRWTDKIAPVMHEWYIWDENGNSEREAKEKRIADTVAHLHATIPFDIRRKLQIARDTGDLPGAMRLLSERVENGRWRDTSQKGAGSTCNWVTLSGEKTLIVKKLFQLI